MATINGTSGGDHLHGSSAADTLNGLGGDDTLDGGGGNDRILGGEGDDYVIARFGNATLDGGAGWDELTYVNAAAAISVHLATGLVTGGAGQQHIDGFERVVGSAFNDTLVGDGGANEFDGGAGNDLIDGAGNAIGAIEDVADVVLYDNATSAVRVDLILGRATGGGGHDTLAGIEGVGGSRFDDTLVGSSRDEGFGGGKGNDSIDGGAGFDVVVVFDATGPVAVNLGTHTSSGADGTDTFVNIEGAFGGKYDDTLVGSGGSNLLVGGKGNDQLRGLAGNDTLRGGEGDDTLDGGTGTDTASYTDADSGVNVSLAIAGVQNTLGAGNDRLIGIERLLGSRQDDRLTGNGGANLLNGGVGADTLTGGDGNDTYVVDNLGDRVVESSAAGGNDLVQSRVSFTLGAHLESLRILATGSVNGTGNALDNLLVAGAGNNVLNGGAGTDTASYAFATSRVSVNLSVTGAQTTLGSGSDRLISIENLVGSAFNDTLAGNAAANVLEGGRGTDTLTGGAGADSFRLTSALAADTVTDFVRGSDKVVVSQAGIVVGDGDTTVDHATTRAGPGGFAATAELVVATGNIAGAISASSAAAAIGSASSAYAVGQTALFVVDNGTSSALYLFNAQDADAQVEASELSLLANLQGTASTGTGDWLFGP